MKGPQPSLVRRLTLGFTLGPLVAIFLLIVAARPILANFSDTNVGPEVALTLLGRDIERREDGTLGLRPRPLVAGIADRSPGFWWMAMEPDGSVRSNGPVPEAALRLVALAPIPVKYAHYGDPEDPERTGDFSIDQLDTEAGRMTVFAGGVDPRAIGLGDWVAYSIHDGELLIGLSVILLICIAGAPIAIPIVLRALRPTARAAAMLDPARLDDRLPERGVVKELLPVVRSFNAALDRLSDAFERRRRFIADVAHELRTPLAVLNMHVESLPPCSAKPDLQRTVYRLGQMVGQMLDAERLALAGREHCCVDLVELTRVAVAEAAPLALSNGYELDFAAAADRVCVRGDPHSIMRAVTNLLGNAIAHGGGSGTIRVGVSRNGAIDVADEGPGVPIEARERIFEPFRRERWDKDGCGLGLHLVREIMHAHDGEAVLVSSGPGALFRLKFGSLARPPAGSP